MPCITITPEIRKLQSFFPGETLSSVTNMVGIWQEREMALGNESVTIESVPDASVLRELFAEVRVAGLMEFKMSKDESSALLDNGDLPGELKSLAKRLGVILSINKRTKTVSVSQGSATREDLRLFRALAIDLVYAGDEVAESKFNMSPRERLAAIIDWESLNRRTHSGDVDIMNYELQLAKRALRDDYGISTDGVMESLRKKAAASFSSRDRMERVAEIADHFDRILSERHEQHLQELADRRDTLNGYLENKDKQDFEDWETAESSYMQELGEIQKELGSYSRLKALKQFTPKAIFDEIASMYSELAAMDDASDAEFANAVAERFDVPARLVKRHAAWYKDQVKKVADNFEVLREEACKQIESAELVRINITYDDSVDVSGERPNASENTVGEEENDVSGIENQYKENWMYEYDTSSNWSKMSAQVRRMLFKCPLGERKTRFGSEYHYPVMQVVNILINEMQGVTTSADMDAVIGTLEGSYSWARYIREQIANDPKLKTQLFKSVRRYAQTLGIIESDERQSKSGDPTSNKLRIINSGNTVNSIYAAVQNQIYSGVPLNKKTSIFEDDEIVSSHVEKAKSLISKYAAPVWDRSKRGWSDETLKTLWDATPENIADVLEEFPDIISDIASVLNSIGFLVSEQDLRVIAVRNVRNGRLVKNNLASIISDVTTILDRISENGYESTEDLLNEDRELTNSAVMPSYRSISETLTLSDNGIIESSTREKGKVRYSYVLPSVLDDLIVGFQGKRFSHVSENGERVNMSISEFIENNFGMDARFAYEEDGETHYRNYILEMLANGTRGISTTGPGYVTVLNVDTKGRKKVEQKDLTQEDRLNMVWSMFFNMEDSKYDNAQGIWFPIPLPSDSGRIAFIKFAHTDEGEQLEIIKEAILKELERMTDDKPDAHLPEVYRKNKSKFCTFPVLNDPKLSGYDIKTILDEYNRSRNTDQYSKFDEIMDDLVAAVVDSMINKFKDENESFYNARVKKSGENIVHDFIIEQSIFQMAINEILNGDAAYYDGYVDMQKRAKQSIVPLDHIDIYNEDFLEAYKEYHGIDDDVELDESDIVEHVLYIDDPKIPSPSYDDLKSLYDDALSDGIIDQDTYDAFVIYSGSIKYTDGQAFRTFDSMVAMMYANGEMSKGDDLDLALHRIAEGVQEPGDSYVIRTALKPFLSGLITVEGSDGDTRLMPVQHKVSEQILTAALVQAAGTKLGASPALKALTRIMEEERADVAIFTSGVKVGIDGAVDFGDVDVENASEEEIYQQMRDSMNEYRNATGKSVIHEIPLSMYGFVAQNPDSGLDDSEIPIGVQLQKLIAADLPDIVQRRVFEGGKWVTKTEKAVYHVNGVGDMTREEIISLYNKLMTEKILRAYKEVTGTFADKKKLSEALIRSCRNSSRNSAYLERAFSLDEYGNFVIPLCDLSTLNMSSEFLNSIVKNAVSRISVPGKQLVSMSAFGFAKDLKIEFERDEDGYPIAYKSIDCLLPAWSRHIINICVNDEGVLDFEKLEKESPQLLKAIGVRIPTQFKNFILPLKCVGFLPTILGDTIVTAIDSVVLQDADFDNDKVPTFFPSFEADYYIDDWEDVAFRDYKEYCDKWYDFDAIHDDFKEFMRMRREEGIEDNGYEFKDFYHERMDDDDFEKDYRRDDAPEGKPMKFGDFKKEHRSEYLRPGGPKLTYVAFDHGKSIKDQSDAALNNGIIDVMRGMLTGKAVSTMSLASGSTAKLKPIKEEIEELLHQNPYPNSPSDIATRIGQETRNNDGKQMISVFANAEAMQSMLQHTHVGLLDGVGVKINGRTLHSLHDVKIEDSLDYISRYIGTALGGAADNAKDPILFVMNINLRTAPVVSLMLQLGYTLREVAMFLNIPSIRHYTDTGNFGDYEEPDMDDLPQELPDDIDYMKKAIAFGDNYDDMNPDLADYCNTALGVYMYLSKVGERLRFMSSLVRGDSGSSAPHGPIENNLARLINVELFAELEAEDPIFENWREVVNYDYDNPASEDAVDGAVIPLAQAYITYGVVGSFRELEKIYPGIGDPNFRYQIKNIIKKYYGGVATPTNVKNIMYSLYNYVMSSYDCMRKDGYTFAESRNYYLTVFPEEAAQLVSAYPDLAKSLFFKRLKLYSTFETDEDPFISLQYDGVMLPQARDEFSTVWQQLFYAENEDGSPNVELRDLAVDLFKYSYFRNGFRFGPGTFAHLAPIEARLFLPGYVEMLNDMQRNISSENYANFEQQFVRNNLYDKKFCLTVPKEVRKPNGWVDSSGEPSDVIKISYMSRMDKTHQDAFEWYFEDGKGSEKPRAAFVITQRMKDGSIRYHYYMKVSDNDVAGESVYALTTPLGWKDKAVEYSAKEPGVTMPSVFDQSDVAESLRPKKYRKKKSKAKRVNETRADSRGNTNSSEEPNESSDEFEDYKFRGFWASTLSGSGYSEIIELHPELKKNKKFQDARAAFLKEKKGTKSSGKKQSKSKQQIDREKKGGKKSSRKFSIVPIDSASDTVISAEAICASTIGAYTICITDEESSQLSRGIHAATQNDNHWVASTYNPDNARALAKDMAKKVARKTVKSIVLNLTGSYMNTIGRYATQEDLDSYVLDIYRALKDEGVFVSKVVSTAQPGIPLASARAAMKLGYVLEIRPTSDYKMYNEVGSGKAVADKDAFLANLNAGLESKEYKSDNRVYDKEEGPFVEAKNPWTREIVSKDKKTLYVFTDNTDRTSGTNKVSSSSGYARRHGKMRILSYPNKTSAVIRGLENAFPISTQKTYSPDNPTAGQWQDSDLAEFRSVIKGEIEDIIEAFRSGEFKRVVIPMGGVLDGPISGITKERTPKLYRELSRQLEYLSDSILEISENEINDDDENEYEPGYKTDNNDVLSGDDIQQSSFTGDEMVSSNVYVINVSEQVGKGRKILDSSGKQIDDSKIFVVIPVSKDGKPVDTRAIIENWQKAKIYSSSGVRILDDLQFTMPSGKTKYSIISASSNGVSLAAMQLGAIPLILTGKRPYNKAGLTWLDDNNEPICK